METQQHKRVLSLQAVWAALIMAVLLCPLFALPAYASECPAGGNHEYKATIIRQATETEDGLRQYVCVKCGYSFTNTIPATGHLWSDWTVTEAPTCVSEGREYRVCTRYPNNPHYEYRTIPALSSTGQHTYSEVARVEATCTESGSVTYVCSVCGDTYTETLAPLGHDWGEWTVDSAPTATTAGSEHRTCLRDASHVEVREIPATGAVEEEAGSSQADGTDGVGGQFTPNALDKALAVVDVTALVAWLIAAVPLIPAVLWIRRKKQAARDAARAGKGAGAAGEDREKGSEE